MNNTLYTIGHSTHAIETFLRLLMSHGVSAVADVRSHPYSRMNPQFNRENLKSALYTAGVAYVFLGHELGARAYDRACYVDGRVEYEKLARTPIFQDGLKRVRDGVRKHRIALMCAEKDPITCHRMVLVCHQLRREPLEIVHIREDGTLETHSHAEKRMAIATGLPESDLFVSSDDLIEEAYRRQGRRIAWVDDAENEADEATRPVDAGWAV